MIMTYYQKHREEILTKTKEYRQKHRKKYLESKKKYYKNNQEKIREYRKKNKRNQYLQFAYGMTEDQYNELNQKQNGKCACCGHSSKRLHVDHDHKTGKVRELLCHGCNTGLGLFRENIERLKLAIEYLTKHQSKTGLGVA